MHVIVCPTIEFLKGLLLRYRYKEDVFDVIKRMASWVVVFGVTHAGEVSGNLGGQ